MKVAILGAGVAGLSSAIALAQQGFFCTLYERQKGSSSLGAGIVCWPNAIFVLTELGVLPLLEGRLGRVTQLNRYDSLGKLRHQTNIDKLNTHMGAESFSVLRVNLIDALCQRARQLGVKIYYDHVAVEINDCAKGVDIQFENGRSINVDKLIGADGRMNSVARKYVNGEATPKFQKVINWVGTFESDHPVFNSMEIRDYWLENQRFGLVPVSATQAYWAVGTTANQVEKLNIEADKKNLFQQIEHWPDYLHQYVRESASMSQAIYLHDHDPITNWHKNNVLLIGDAVHAPLPTSGQGACQALEDAWHLGNILAEHKGVWSNVFNTFSERRREKTSAIIMSGRHLASTIFFSSMPKTENLSQIVTQQDTEGLAKFWGSGLPIKS